MRYALTPAQKRAKAKEMQNANAKLHKRKAEKKAKEQRKPKPPRKNVSKTANRCSMSIPTICRPANRCRLRISPCRTSTHVPTRNPKSTKRPDNKRARVSKGLPAGEYWAVAAKTGYFSSDTIRFDHQEDGDSVAIAVYPETRLTFTVTDSLTSRPVAANMIVRNPNEHAKSCRPPRIYAYHAWRSSWMTACRSIRSMLQRSIISPSMIRSRTHPLFKGVVMSPREIKVPLHDFLWVYKINRSQTAAKIDEKR